MEIKGNITLAEAKRLSLIKWNLIVEGKDYENHPKLKHIKYCCGFCERWKDIGNCDDYVSDCGCDQCVFAHELGNICYDDQGLFMRWHDCRSSKARKTKAKQILEHIKNIKITEE